MRVVSFLAALFFCASVAPASAEASPWSVTLYGGPATYTIFTQTLAGNFQINDGVVGIAVNRRLARLGWGWNLVGEAQYQQFLAGHTYPSFSLGLGVEYHDFPWERQLPTAFSAFIGPTYSVDPPLFYPVGQWGSRKSLLNYVSLELAFALPNARKWDTVMRIYHRSGVWGIYTLDADEVTVVGVGVRYRF